MSDYVLSILKDIQLGQLIAIGGMLWFFYSRLDGKIQRVEERLENKINGLEKRMNNLESRLSVIEAILAMMGAPVKGFHNPKTDP